MSVFAGLVTGLLSAVSLIILWFSIVGAATIVHTSLIFFLIIFIILWVGSTCGIVVGAQSASAVWARGGQVGTFEWLLISLLAIGRRIGYRMSAVNHEFSPAGFGNAFFPFEFIATLWIGFVLFMGICSLTVWFVAKQSQTALDSLRSTATSGDKPSRRPCTHCAEEILLSAKICPFCKMTVGQENVCLECDALIPFEGRYCPQCGKLTLPQP